MRSYRVEREVDLLVRFPGARVRPLGEHPVGNAGYRSREGVRGIERLEALVAGDVRDALFEHPDRRVVFPEVGVPHGASLRFGCGIREEVWDRIGGEVRFRIFLRTGDGDDVTVFDSTVDPATLAEHRRWFDQLLDLSRWGGETVDLLFETAAGPTGNTDFAWAVWSAPELVDREGNVACALLERLDDLLIATNVVAKSVYEKETCIGDDLRAVLFQHPDSAVRFDRLRIHAGAELEFGVGIDPAVWDKEGDGVEFQVWVEADGSRERLYRRYVDPKSRPDDRRWFDERVSLEAYRGREIALELITGAGEAGDARFDWAVWSHPVIRSRGREVRIADPGDMNFLLVTLDTFRADHLGCMGNRPVRSPHLDALAGRGLLFRNARAQSNITIPSHLAVLTGKLPHHHATSNRRQRLGEDLATLPGAFRGAGYATFAGTSVHILAPHWVEGLERHFQGFDALEAHRRIGERTAASFRQWLEGHFQEPFFAWVHLFDTHAPYVPTQAFRNLYYRGDERDPAHAGLGDLSLPPFMEEVRQWLSGVTDPEFPAAQYAAQATHVDSIVGDLLEDLERLGVGERTAVAVVADHGESLGEHGVHYNHVGLFDEVVRVPLLLALPPNCLQAGRHALRGRNLDADVMAADLCPTLLDLARLPVPEGLDGRSLLPLARGEVERLHDQVVAQHTDLAQVMIVRDGWKYLRSRRDIEYSASFSIRAGEEHLFDLRRDPAEVHDLAPESPEPLAALRRRMDQIESSFSSEGGASEIETDAIMLKRLQSLGYL